MVARFVRDEEAVGSNPATPTSEVERKPCFLLRRARKGSEAAKLPTTPTLEVNEYGASVGPTVEGPIVWLAVG